MLIISWSAFGETCRKYKLVICYQVGEKVKAISTIFEFVDFLRMGLEFC